MITSVRGTIKDWIAHDPKAMITNQKYLQKGVALFNFKELPTEETFMYPIAGRPPAYSDPDNLHLTPFIYFGPQCPYMVKGKFKYQAIVMYLLSGSMGVFPLSDEMVNDTGWEWYSIEEYEKGR